MAGQETWGDYSKLVLKELERLNEGQEKMREDIDIRFKEMNTILSEFKNTEKNVLDHKNWIEKVNDVWSPAQMKEAKDEIYKQKNKWIAMIAVLTFVQIIFGIIFTMWDKLKH
jgi:hypothetical protein